MHAMSHITGGGLANNLARVIPGSAEVRIDRTSWQPAPIFGLLQRLGGITQADLEATFNMGVGMVAVLPPDAVDAAIRVLGRARAAGLGLRIGGARRVGYAGAGQSVRVTLLPTPRASRGVSRDHKRVSALHVRDHWVALPSRH